MVWERSYPVVRGAVHAEAHVSHLLGFTAGGDPALGLDGRGSDEVFGCRAGRGSHEAR